VYTLYLCIWVGVRRRVYSVEMIEVVLLRHTATHCNTLNLQFWDDRSRVILSEISCSIIFFRILPLCICVGVFRRVCTFKIIQVGVSTLYYTLLYTLTYTHIEYPGDFFSCSWWSWNDIVCGIVIAVGVCRWVEFAVLRW